MGKLRGLISCTDHFCLGAVKSLLDLLLFRSTEGIWSGFLVDSRALSKGPLLLRVLCAVALWVFYILLFFFFYLQGLQQTVSS